MQLLELQREPASAGSLFLRTLPNTKVQNSLAELIKSTSAFTRPEPIQRQIPSKEEQEIELTKRAEQDQKSYANSLPFLAMLFPSAFMEQLNTVLPNYAPLLGNGMSEDELDDEPLDSDRYQEVF